MDTDLLTAEAVAEQMGVSVYTVWRWIRAGRLRAFKPGREYRVRRADLEEFMRAREVRPKAPLARLSPDEFDELRASANAGEADGAKLLEGVLHEYNAVEAYWKRLEQAGAQPEDLEEARELLAEARKRWRVVMFDRTEETIAGDHRRDPERIERPDIRDLPLEEAHAQLAALRIIAGAY